MKFNFENSLFSYFRLDEVSREKSAAVSEQIQTIRQLSVQNETLTQSFKVKTFFSFALFVRLWHIISVITACRDESYLGHLLNPIALRTSKIL